MGISLHLDRMTTSEKLAAIELLWEDLCKHTENVPTIPWHGTVLSEREKKISGGELSFSDLSEAKGRIQGATQ